MTENNSFNIEFDNLEQVNAIFGVRDQFLKLIETSYEVASTLRDNQLTIQGDAQNVQSVEQVIEKLKQINSQGVNIGVVDVNNAIHMQKNDTLEYFSDLYSKVLIKDFKGRSVRVKSIAQKEYVAAINHSDIVFGVGPAGTGKTYLAVAMAINALRNNEVERIIITRPAVEAGESLGFLPGDLKEKVDPYLRPIYDALYNLVGLEQATRWIESGIIEVAPLAYMRGRTLDNAFIILDEAQNTTEQQMKMFLTRIGFNSKMIVNGDLSQIDLPVRQKSGLVQATKILKNIRQISIVEFTADDVVRHPIVGLIVDAYDRAEND